jgi:hypothetical protein
MTLSAFGKSKQQYNISVQQTDMIDKSAFRMYEKVQGHYADTSMKHASVICVFEKYSLKVTLLTFTFYILEQE